MAIIVSKLGEYGKLCSYYSYKMRRVGSPPNSYEMSRYISKVLLNIGTVVKRNFKGKTYDSQVVKYMGIVQTGC